MGWFSDNAVAIDHVEITDDCPICGSFDVEHPDGGFLCNACGHSVEASGHGSDDLCPACGAECISPQDSDAKFCPACGDFVD